MKRILGAGGFFFLGRQSLMKWLNARSIRALLPCLSRTVARSGPPDASLQRQAVDPPRLLWPSPPSFEGPRNHEKPSDFMTSERYNARESEPRWQRQWDEKAIFASKNDDPRPKYYVLEMFPYPSGRIHMGHVRNYTLGDVRGALQARQGLHRAAPDGLGRLRPAGRERGARARHPSGGMDLRQHRRPCGRSCSDGAVARLEPRVRDLRPRLLQAISRSCSWTSCARAWPSARRAGSTGIRWTCTVLANEQVIDGRGWRSGAPVEKRELSQWFFKITELRAGTAGGAGRSGPLAGPGAADAGELDRPQRGRAVPLRAGSRERRHRPSSKVYTTRPDTLFGMSFLAMAPEHPLARRLPRRDPARRRSSPRCRSMGTARR